MDELAAYLRARYHEEIDEQQQRRRTVPSIFDGHQVEIRGEDGIQTVLVDGHPYPAEEYAATATRPAPDRETLAELHAKLELIDFRTWPGGPAVRAAWEYTVRLLAARYERRKDFPRPVPANTRQAHQG